MAKKDDISIGSLFDLAFTELEQSNFRGNALTYEPYSDQVAYHQSQTRGRYASGGNRAGKTDAQVMDMYWTATDSHPYRKRDELHPTWGHGPVQLRWFAPDVEKGIKMILLPKLRRWVPRSACIEGDFFQSWDPQASVFTFANGSTLDVLTYGMAFEKLGGVPRHAVYFDEEPPLEIFNETMMRLRDYNGEWSIAATPVNGITWTYDRLWEPAENYWKRVLPLGCTARTPKPQLPPPLPDGEVSFISVHELDPANNPYLDSDLNDVEELTVAMDKEEKDIREHGKFVAKSGLVFPNFSRETHVLPVALSIEQFRGWKWYSSVDVGWSNPTAWLWHAVAPDGRIYTFAEHYASKMTVAEHAAIVLERERAWDKTPEIRTGDPAMKQVTGQTGTSYLIEYGRRGIGIGVDGVPHDVQIGVEKMQQYIQIQPYTGWGENTPTWMISPNCPNLIRELKKLRWATYDSTKMTYDRNKKEEIHKKDDHASDSARYFFTLMPDLRPLADFQRPGAEVPLNSYAGVMAQVVAGQQRDLSSIATTNWATLAYDEGEY